MKRQSQLVCNAGSNPSFAALICNLSPALVRLETLEEKEYTVVPMVILTEGVHAGSGGPLYYPPEELSKTPAAWNHKPVVVYHPSMNGEPLSACEPTIINSRKVGLMMNTRWEEGKLKSEAWLDRSKADKVDQRIMEAVDSQEIMELSTGVFLDVDRVAGEWQGKPYVGIARNFRADHLALLPDQVGACSIQDGAGLLRNARKAGLWPAFKRFLESVGITSNANSFSDTTRQLTAALNSRFNPSESPSVGVWVEDVFDNYVVYTIGMDRTLWRLNYTKNGDKITLSSDAPMEVVRTTEYKSVSNATNKQKQTNMNKKNTVDAIINAKKGWGEDDRAALMELSEEQLKIVQNNLQAPAPAAAAAPVQNAAPKPKEGETKADFMARCGEMMDDKSACSAMWDKMNPTSNTAAPKVTTVEDYIGAAPAGIQDVLRNAQSVYADEKNRLIEAITKNANNSFSKQDLEGRPLGELKNLARLAGVSATPAPNYAGMAPTQTANTSQEPALELPVMNFEKK